MKREKVHSKGWTNISYRVVLNDIFTFLPKNDDNNNLNTSLFGRFKRDRSKNIYQIIKTVTVSFNDWITSIIDIPKDTKKVKIFFATTVDSRRVKLYFDYIRWIRDNSKIVQYLIIKRRDNSYNLEKVLACFIADFKQLENHKIKMNNVFRLIYSKVESLELESYDNGHGLNQMITIMDLVKKKLILEEGETQIEQNLLFSKLKEFSLYVDNAATYDNLKDYKLPEVPILNGHFYFHNVYGTEGLFSKNVWTGLKIGSNFQFTEQNPGFTGLKVHKLKVLNLAEQSETFQKFPQILGTIKVIPNLVTLGLCTMIISAEHLPKDSLPKLKNLSFWNVKGVFDFHCVNSDIETQIQFDHFKIVNLGNEEANETNLTLLNFNFVSKIGHLDLHSTKLDLNKEIVVQKLEYSGDFTQPLTVSPRNNTTHLVLLECYPYVRLQVEQDGKRFFDNVDITECIIVSNRPYKLMDKLFNNVKDLNMYAVKFFDKVRIDGRFLDKDVIPIRINNRSILDKIVLEYVDKIYLNILNPVKESVKFNNVSFVQTVLNKKLFQEVKKIALRKVSIFKEQNTRSSNQLNITIDNKNLQELEIKKCRGIAKSSSDGLNLVLTHPFKGKLKLKKVHFYNKTKKRSKHLMRNLFDNASDIHIDRSHFKYLDIHKHFIPIPLRIDHNGDGLQRLLVTFEEHYDTEIYLKSKTPIQQSIELTNVKLLTHLDENFFDNAREISLKSVQLYQKRYKVSGKMGFDLDHQGNDLKTYLSELKHLGTKI